MEIYCRSKKLFLRRTGDAELMVSCWFSIGQQSQATQDIGLMLNNAGTRYLKGAQLVKNVKKA
jgi:hypothetical protein